MTPLNWDSAKKDGGQDPLSWLVDILSRPMRIVENPINVAATEAKKRATQGDKYDVVGGAFNQIMSPFTGFFSTDPQHQPTGDKIIENVTDAIGLNTDPNYKDVQDNVNPIVKGVGGFVADVALDPLTYVPGGIATSALRGGVKGAQAVRKGVQVADKLAKTAEVAGNTGAKAVAATEAASKPFASNVVAGMLKGAVKGVPNTSAVGTFTKALKPVGLAEWGQRRAYDKVFKASKRLGVSAEDLIKVSKDPTYAAKAAAASTKTIDGDQLLRASQRLSKAKSSADSAITKADIWTNKLSALTLRRLRSGPFAEAARVAEQLTQDTPAAPTVKADKPLTAVETIAQKASLEDAQKMADSILTRQAATDAPVPAQALDLNGWLAEQVTKAATSGTHKVAHGAAAVGTREIPAGIIKNAELKSLAKLYKLNKQGKLIPIPGAKYDVTNLVNLNAKIKVAYAKYVDDLAQASTEAGKVKASRKIMDLITGQSEQANLVLGAKAVEILGKASEDKQLEAVKYLSDILSKKVNADEIGKFGTSVRDRFTKAVFENHGIDIPGTNARQLQSAEKLADPINVEAAGLSAQGKTLKDHPEFAGMDEDQVKVVANAFGGWMEEFLRLAGYPFKSRKGADKTVAAFGEGLAKWSRQLNTPDQVNLYTALVDDAVKTVKKLNESEIVLLTPSLKVAANVRAGYVVNEAIKAMRLAFGWTSSKGITGALGLNNNVVHLYADQALEVMRAFGNINKNVDTLYAAIGNVETNIPLGNIFNAIVAKQLNPNITSAELFDLLKAPITIKKAGAKAPFNILNSGPNSPRRYGFSNTAAKPEDRGYFTYVKKPKVKGYYRVVKDPEALGKDLVRMIEGTADDMSRVIKANDEALLSRITSETHFMSDEAWNILENAARDQESLLESLRILADPDKWFKDMSTADKATPQATENSIALMKGRASAVWQTTAMRTAADLRSSRVPVNPKMSGKQNAAASAERHAQDAVKQGKRVNQDSATREAELGPDAYGEQLNEFDHLANQVDHGIWAWIKSRFSTNFGVEDVLENFENTSMAFHTVHSSMKDKLNLLNKKYSGPKTMVDANTTLLDKAWRDWANNVDSLDTEEARKDIQKLMDSIIGPDGELEGSIFRGIPIDAFEAAMTRARLPLELDYDLIDKWAKFDETSMEVALFKHFKEIVGTTNNPIDVMEALHYAGAASQMSRGSAALFAQIPGAVVYKATKGFSKISEDVNALDNPLIYFLPKNTYINDEIIGQIRKLEKIMAEPRVPSGTLGKFVTETYLPVLAAWKGAVTIMRPGHHLRNFISSYFLQAGDLGFRNLNRSVTLAGKVLFATRGSKAVDYTKMLSSLGVLEAPRKGDVLFIDPKLGKITTDMVDEASLKKGLYAPVAISEDIAGAEVTNKLAEVGKTLTAQNSKLGDAGKWLSRSQNDINRLSYFIQYVLNEGPKGYYKTWDDLASAAAANSRRVNPDGSMLTNWEKRNMRLLVPFYAWNRRVLPQVFGMIADHPARFMLLPKASYNTAVAMGINPQSMQDPFPEDQMFPQFIKDQLLGPTIKFNGKYYNILPGFAQNDILNTFVGDPGAQLPQQISPFIRIPAEVLSGSKWGSNAKINDLSDYIDSNLPMLNYISNFSGTSVTGSVMSLLQGKGLDPQYQVFKGNRGAGEQATSGISWITGVGLQNLSTPNLINYAELEKRNKAAQEQPGSKNPF